MKGVGVGGEMVGWWDDSFRGLECGEGERL